MSDKPVLQPGPDHPITIERNNRRVVVSVAGRVVADTTSAVTLREAAYAPVQYIPLEDVDSSLLEASDHSSYCPYKGDASYYTVKAPDGSTEKDVVWTYEHPYPSVAEIAGHVAFYADRAEVTVGRP